MSAIFNRTATAATHQSLQQLLSGHWSLSATGTGIQRTYEFRGFNGAMKFWNRVADECKIRKHHPEWANVYNRVEIRWTTHEPRGLGHIDAEMAQFCDQVAEDVGLKKAVPSKSGDMEMLKGVDSGNTATEKPDFLDGMIPPGTECELCAKGSSGVQ